MKNPVIAAVAFLVLISLSVLARGQEDSWSDRIAIKGDLRLRYEGISEDGEEDRTRGRYRMRLGVTADASEDVKVVVEFASGADNPVSRNVTFDGGFSGDDIGLDLAYVEWSASDTVTVYGGKMKNPFFVAGGAPVMWDSDLNPDGLALKFNSGAFFGSAAVLAVEERSSSSDTFLTAVQGGATISLGDIGELTAGLGYFSYSNTIGNEPFWDGSRRGNSVDVDGNYLYGYKITEVSAALDTAIGDFPLSLHALWVKNGDADTEDSAYAIGAKLGAPGDGKWSAGWTYMDVEADAVVATFNDSDFAGGQTDAKGHILKVSYELSPAVTLGGSFFINEIDMFAGNPHDYDRFQLDVQFGFE